ncbi:MAG: hypothetical protein LUD25_00360 [Coriobacteriaceae bacterium]|nr:hypothetical protein [Coriobacteriaceae bacterium]
MISFTEQGKKVRVYPASGSDKPVVYFHTVMDFMTGRVYKQLQNLESPDCTFVAIGGLSWSHDMTPWDCPPISKHDTPCTGGADDYLELLTQKIMPKAEENIDGTPAWRGITGYSLAGLFAVYAPYQTDAFTRVASMSGSMWFPDFKEYVFDHEPKAALDHVFFSLGDQEAQTDNTFIQPVQENTAEIQRFYAEHGIDSVFELNPGGHQKNSMKRTAAGIDWILRN